MFKKLLPIAIATVGLIVSNVAFVNPNSLSVSAQSSNSQKKETVDTNTRNGRGLDSMKHFNVSISVPDVNASVEWYQRVLGFRKISQADLSNGVSIAMIERNGVVIEFLEVANSQPMPMLNLDPPNHLKYQGIKNFVLWVDDMDTSVRELKAKNIQFVWEARELREVGTRVTMFRDNNNNLITLWERRGNVWERLNRP